MNAFTEAAECRNRYRKATATVLPAARRATLLRGRGCRRNDSVAPKRALPGRTGISHLLQKPPNLVVGAGESKGHSRWLDLEDQPQVQSNTHLKIVLHQLANATSSPRMAACSQRVRFCRASVTESVFISPPYRRPSPGYQRPPDLLHDLLIACLSQFMFPNPYDRPALSAQFPADSPVACLVCRQLLLPEGGVLHRLITVPAAPVPETAVHKHRQSLLGEGEIRPDLGWPALAGRVCWPGAPLGIEETYDLLSSPPGNAMRPQQFRQRA